MICKTVQLEDQGGFAQRWAVAQRFPFLHNEAICDKSFRSVANFSESIDFSGGLDTSVAARPYFRRKGRKGGAL